jgi:hypothetical protein
VQRVAEDDVEKAMAALQGFEEEKAAYVAGMFDTDDDETGEVSDSLANCQEEIDLLKDAIIPAAKKQLNEMRKAFKDQTDEAIQRMLGNAVFVGKHNLKKLLITEGSSLGLIVDI